MRWKSTCDAPAPPHLSNCATARNWGCRHRPSVQTGPSPHCSYAPQRPPSARDQCVDSRRLATTRHHKSSAPGNHPASVPPRFARRRRGLRYRTVSPLPPVAWIAWYRRSSPQHPKLDLASGCSPSSFSDNSGRVAPSLSGNARPTRWALPAAGNRQSIFAIGGGLLPSRASGVPTCLARPQSPGGHGPVAADQR